jgi:hypothetical protein
VARDASGNFAAGTITAALTGNASTATTLQTARTIGGVSFNGAANINLAGVNTAGNQNTSGNAATATVATTLQTARTINGVSFNGSANITVADSTKLPTAGGTMTGQIISTLANSTSNGGGQIYLNGATGNRIDFAPTGVAAPTFTTRSVGTKIVLYQSLDASTVDYALGIDSSTLWSSVGTTAAQFKWYGGTTLAMTLSGTGNLTAVGTVTAPTFNTTSDIRLKDNIRTFESAMDVVSQLRGVRFAWKETGVETVGLIAQEVEKVLPELIGTNADTGLKSVSYANMVAVLIEAVKELKAEIEELKKR